MLVVALVGRAGAGKGVVAGILMDAFPVVGAVRIIPMAAPMKQMASAMGVPSQSLYGTPEQKMEPLPRFGGKSGRAIMQLLGTEFGRKMIGSDVWLTAWSCQVEVARREGVTMVIMDDCRFENEARLVREEMNGTVVRVVRRSSPGIPEDDVEVREHSSEAEGDRIEVHFTLTNDASITELKQEVTRRFQNVLVS
jgi:hypothetical protein